MTYITRKYIQNHPNILFLFGDNDQRRGLGGMAKDFRGEPNVFGIRTKHAPLRAHWAYYTDTDLEKNRASILQDIASVVRKMQNYRAIWIPKSLGTGLASLQSTAPRTLEFLKGQLKMLRDKYSYCLHNE